MLVSLLHVSRLEILDTIFFSSMRATWPAYTFPKSRSKLYHDRQSVGQFILMCGTHLGPATNLSLIIFRQLRVCWCGAPSLTRSRVCSFQFLLSIASAAFLWSESHGTREHILLSLFLRLPQPGAPCSCIYFPQEKSSPVIPPGIGFIFPRFIVLISF
jgi:hypothetical protein